MQKAVIPYEEKETWWQRNRTKVLVIAGIAVAAAVGGVLLYKNRDAIRNVLEPGWMRELRLEAEKEAALRDWVKDASDTELEYAYEIRRIDWLNNDQNGTGIITPEMRIISDETYRRFVEKWEMNPNRNTDPHFRWSDANRWERD